ncbi:MAG: glycerate kinase [Eubacteriales bacterium]|nr:glycerate kinase [Eubacteriales bacterium]
MGASLRKDAETIIADSIREVQPDSAVIRALKETTLNGKIKLVAAGKAAWQMAKAASNYLGERLEQGIVITKYGHVRGELPRIRCCEAGHPVPDEGSFDAARKALALTENLTKDDTVLFLLSGGGSALFELPLIPAEALQDVTRQLLACGADIVEINTLRKRLSAVKGGRFAQHCAPAKVFSIILSDILGDPPDMIASGPTCPDSSTCADAMEIVRRYDLSLNEETRRLLTVETPKTLANARWMITGSVRELCAAAARSCRKLGYEPFFLTDRLCCQAREAGSVMASILRTHAGDGKKLAFLAGGETVVRLTGSGKGGRNQELALAAAEGISGLSNAALFSVGSDGTDGPTDAAGGFVDGATRQRLLEEGIHIDQVLLNNDAYHALQRTDGLIFTGPTGTNVNDVTVGLVEG